MERSTKDLDYNNFLPHREPMLMVHRLNKIGSEDVEAEFDVGDSCIFVQNGKLQASGMIESLAQVCTAVLGQRFFDASDRQGSGNKVVGYINSLKSLEIFELPKVGDTLLTSAKLQSRMDFADYSICDMECTGRVAGELSVTCLLKFLIHEVPV